MRDEDDNAVFMALTFGFEIYTSTGRPLPVDTGLLPIDGQGSRSHLMNEWDVRIVAPQKADAFVSFLGATIFSRRHHSPFIGLLVTTSQSIDTLLTCVAV